MTADPDPTVELLRGWHAGDRDALETLIRRNAPWVSHLVRGRLGPRLRAAAQTEDFVQEAMLDVLEYGPRFELADEDQFRRLLARIVENNLRDRQKWLLRHRRDAAREKGRASDTVLKLDAPVRSVTSPSQHAQRAENEEWVRLALELLQPADRDVLWLREWEGQTFDEIGGRLGIAADAARMRFKRALPRLADKVVQLKDGRMARLLAEVDSTSTLR